MISRPQTFIFARMQHKQATRSGSPRPASTSLGPGKRFLLTGMILLITFLAFSPALKNGFINWDDNATVFENPQLRQPAPEAIRYFFGQHYVIGNYIPLTMTAYVLEYQAAALKPQFYHQINLLIHLANVLLVFWFIYLLSKKRVLVATLVALFFGIHPMHVESVAWIAELKDVLYSFFFIAGCIVYYKYLEANVLRVQGKKNPVRLLLVALLFFILSVLSKPAAVVFPLVLLLLDFYTGRKSDKWIWIEKIPFFLISCIFGIIAIRAQQADRLLHDDYTVLQKICFASHSLLCYLVKLVLPLRLSIFYPYPQLVNEQLPWQYYLAPLGVMLAAYGVYRTLRHSRLVTFGTLFFFITIVLMLQLISIGDAVMAERYTYIPYIGLFFIAGMSLDQFCAERQSLKPMVIAAVAVLAITYACLTYRRCKVWKNDDTIATDLLSKFPDDRIALNNKGFILYTQGRYQEAIPLYAKAIQQKPDYARAHINLINAYMALNDYDRALQVTEAALKQDPLNHHLFTKKGYLLFRKQRYDEAVKLYREAIRLQKDDLNAYLNLSECYYVMRDYDRASRTLDTALSYDPQNYLFLNNKGYILFVKGHYTEAVPYFQAALKSNPEYAIASANLSNCYQAMRDSARVQK